MSEFDFSMKADGSQALKESDKVEGSLAAVEARAKAVGSAMTSSWGAAARAANPLQAGLAKIAEQLQREEQMFQRLHKPLNDLQADMAALEALNSRGVLTAKMYADELARIGKNAGLARGNPADAVSLSMPKAGGDGGGFFGGLTQGGDLAGHLAGQLASVAGPAALAAAGIQAIGEAFEQWQHHEADTRNATNAILKFHDSIESAQGAMAEQEQLSEDLHLNITKTAKAYADVREATEDYGLSSKQVTDITRNMAAALIADGGSIESVSSIMGRLQMATEAGSMSIGQLKSIFRDSPEIIKSFEASTHRSYAELLKMAAAGKLNTFELEKMVRGLGTGHEAIDKMNMRLKTAKEYADEFDVSIYEGMLMLAKAKEGYVDFGETVPEFIERVTAAHQHQIDVMKKLADQLALLRVQSTFDVTASIAKAGLKAQSIVEGLATPWEKYRTQIADTTKDLSKAGFTHEQVAAQIARIHPPEWVDFYKQQLDAIKKPELEWNGRVHALDTLLHNHTITINEYNVALKNLSATYLGMDLVGAISAANGKRPDARDTEAKAFERYQAGLEAPDEDGYNGNVEWKNAGSFGKINMGNTDPWGIEGAKDATKGWKESLDEIVEKQKVIQEAFSGALKDGASSFGNALVDAANGADVSWMKLLGDIVVGFEKAIVQALILRAIGSFGVAGQAGSGLLGALQGGNHATGGSYTARGSGGTDSVPVLFRMSPGERADFTPQGQNYGGGSGAGDAGRGGAIVVPAPQVHIHDDADRRALRAMSGPAGSKIFIDLVRNNQSLLRSALGLR